MSKTHNAGIVTAYGAAVRGGYTGTYEEFCAQQAQYAENARQVEQAVSDVRQIKTSVESAVSEAEGYANNANQSATNASNSATQASESASNANQSAESASQFANNASNSANSASQSATSAQTSANNASTSERNARQSAETAQDVLDSVQAEGNTQINRVQSEGNTQIGRIQAKGNEVLDSLPDDFTEIQNELNVLNGSLGDVKADLANVNNAAFIVTDNQIDFTQDFEKWLQGYPGGTQRYVIHLDEQIEAEAGQVVYGKLSLVTLEHSIFINIRPYNSNDEMIAEYNVASTNGGPYHYTLPEGTSYYYISLTTLSARYPITPAYVKALNLEIYCGPTDATADNVYPKYESISDKVTEIEETKKINQEYGFVSAIDSSKNVRYFGPYEKSYTVASSSDNWKVDSYIVINPEFNIGDYVAIKCEAFHGYGTNGLSIVCKDANNANTLSVTLLRNQLSENGFITKYFQIPANTVKVICTIYGVSNTSSLPEADKPVVGDIAYIKGAYAIVAKTVPQINPLFRIYEQPETLWNEEDVTRENHENVYSSVRIGYVFLTDLHVDYEDNPTGTAFQKNQLKIACDIANCSDIDFLVLGGDYIDGKGTRATATKWMRWITAGLKTINKPVIVCRGNHDKNNNASPEQAVSEQVSTEAFYSIMQAPFRRPEYIYDDNATVSELYFYYDIPRKKTRIIAYDSIFCDNPDEQIKWICEQALNKPDAGWKFIIVTHVPFNNKYNTAGMNWVAQYGEQMKSIITALNNRTTYTGTAGTYSISVDFTMYQSSVVCISTGHEHTGLVAWDSDTDCFFTTTGCACANAGYSTFNDSSVVRDDAQTTGRNNMAFDNPLKYCFDILSVSAESTTRSRFGNGTDKTVNKP